MRLLILNLRTDADDTALGFTTAWINALSERCESVEVVTMRTGRIAVRDNVRVHTIDHDRYTSRVGRLLAFYRTVVPVVRGRRPDACFAHMTPLLAILFKPLALWKGVPILLWYAHKAVPWSLRIAVPLVDRCVSSTPEGFRLPSGKVRFVNQGIDTDRFTPPTTVADGYARTAISVGRISPIKHVNEVIDAVVMVRERGVPLKLDIVGEPLTADDRRYVELLRTLVIDRQLDGVVRFLGNIPFTQVPEAYHRGSLFVSASQSGSMDKALLEAMASGCIPISRNDAFCSVMTQAGLDWLVPEPGAEGLASHIVQVSEMPASRRSELRRRLREVVVRDHGLDRLATRLIEELQDLTRP